MSSVVILASADLYESYNPEFPPQLLLQSRNPGVIFEYTVPKENITETREPEFNWKYMDWTHCTASCGGGMVSIISLIQVYGVGDVNWNQVVCPSV